MFLSSLRSVPAVQGVSPSSSTASPGASFRSRRCTAPGSSSGGPLDRTKARALGRELRRLDAQAVARRALRARDHTAASLEQRLAARGTPATVRRDTVEAAQRAGLVDDRRFAMQRAEQLASRGSGDLLIGDDLERQGVPPELARLAIDALEPEAARADTIVAARG